MVPNNLFYKQEYEKQMVVRAEGDMEQRFCVFLLLSKDMEAKAQTLISYHCFIFSKEHFNTKNVKRI